MNIAGFLNQTAVYWGSPTIGGTGQIIYADEPVEVKVRWAATQEKFNASTRISGVENAVVELVSKTVVLSEADFEIDGALKLGNLLDLTSDQLPENNNALTIKGYAKIPTKYADQFLRKAWLV